MGIVTIESDSNFTISFPDFPGCFSACESIVDVVSMATEALTGHIECMKELNYPIPTPSGIQKVSESENFCIPSGSLCVIVGVSV